MIFLVAPARSENATLPADRDNTIYGESPSLSSGSGTWFFAGATGGGNTRRALVRFDVSSIPLGATIDSVTLTLNMDRSSTATAYNIGLHRVVADWGEAGSVGEGGGAAAQTGDATWGFRFFNSIAWTTAGGDFVPVASALQSVAGIASYSWSSDDLKADIQAWVADPSTNFGWILVSSGEGTARSAKRFRSRENGLTPPSLVIEFTSPVATERTTWGAVKALFESR